MTFPGDDGLRRSRRRGGSNPAFVAAGSPAFTIMSVCTGNICRSPMSEQLFRARLGAVATAAGEPLFRFTSSGVQTRSGIPMDATSAKFSAQLGGDVAGFASSAISEPLTSGADLILTMTRQHLVDAAKRYPSILLRAFTLKEFARVLPFVLDELERPAATDAEPANRLRAIVRQAAANRGRVAAGSRSDDDIKDPIGRDESYHAAVAHEIDSSISTITAAVQRALA